MQRNDYSRPVSSLTEKERAAEILTLELERERIKRELEQLCREYARAVGSGEPVRRAKRVGRGVNDYTYWHKEIK